MNINNAFSQILDQALTFQRAGQMENAEALVNEATEKVKSLDWNTLSPDELNAAGYSLHRLTSDVAYRVSYKCYEDFIHLMEDSVKDCPGKNLALSNYYINECNPIKGVLLSQRVVSESSDPIERIDAGNILCLGLMYQGKYGDAITHAERILAHENPNQNIQVNLWRKIADANMTMEHYKAAHEALDKAESVFEDHKDLLLHMTTHIRRAILLSREGNYLQALNKFKEMLEGLPNINPGQLALIIGNVGITLERAKEPISEDLISFFKNNVKLENDNDLPMEFVRFAYNIQKGRYTRYILSANLIKMHSTRKEDIPSEYKTIQEENNGCHHVPSGWDVL